jgi:hypothetical protein
MSVTTQRLSGTALGSLNITQYDKFIITTTGACTATLPNGYEGQEVYIIMVGDNGDLVVSGDYQVGSSATFSDVLDSLKLMWISGLGWTTLYNGGVVIFS